MRRCVFLAVVPILMLSLSEGNSTENTTATTATTSPTATGNSTENTTATTATTSPTATGNSTENTTATTATTSPTATGNSTENTTATTATTSPTATGNSTENTTATTATTSPTATGNSTENTTATTATTSPTATGNSTENTTATTATTSPTATGNSTENTTATTATTSPTATGNSTENTTATTATTSPTATGNSTENTTATTATTSPTATGDLCNPDPCGKKLAKCVALYSTFTCLCQYGFYYRNKDCHRGKIYPGVINLKGFYSDSIQTVNSTQYEEMFQNTTKFFKDAFKSLAGFEQTVIVEIQPVKEGRASLPVSVTVANLFMENSTVNTETVSSAVTDAVENSPYVSQYRATTYCAAFKCDVQTTNCIESMFPKCVCKSSFSKTEWDDRSCSDCSKDCSAEENKYCAKEKGTPTCKCMPNFEKKNDKCVPCPVGYSGENCKNNSELILIIVGTVFGAIILSLVIAVSIVSVRARRKQDPEKKRLIKSGNSNPNTSDDRQTMMFPRVQTTSGHGNPGYQPNNPYEMRSTNRGHFPERDYEDLYEASRESEGFRMQSRY